MGAASGEEGGRGDWTGDGDDAKGFGGEDMADGRYEYKASVAKVVVEGGVVIVRMTRKQRGAAGHDVLFYTGASRLGISESR